MSEDILDAPTTCATPDDLQFPAQVVYELAAPNCR